MEALGGAGTGSIQLSSSREHTANLVEADYKDADSRDVLITLSANQYDALYDLEMMN